MPKILTDEQINFYHEKGYVKVEQVLPQRSIDLGRKVCADWVDRTVQGWVAEGLLEDGLEHLDLGRRLTAAWNQAGKPRYHRSPRRQIVCPELFQFMSEPNVIDIAEDLLGTPEVFMHGVFNYRMGFANAKLGYGSAIGWVLALIIFGLSFIQLYLFGAFRKED